ncbi:cupin domain-containing protein [Actinophytocola oryzae]|uniref:Quercetin dioxygenase-like cupin family protein n=1 Tax=Actinophytocola oryzae TaxID=502181 RepID=A0A4R7VRN0_9PSEU|nr:cupin domain-containing protein [Actinophytocola oryzae]TDV52322.1 quercetin dioxygenase-like cupin family protein [Actinophytocola oryzae]
MTFTGEINATYRPVATPPELDGPRTRTRFLATGDLTDGHFGLFQWDMVPEAGGPAAHYHKTFSESFYVLDGTVSLFDGANWVTAVRGDYLYVPPNGIHAFRNESDEPASMLILFAPGAPREKYFTELAEIVRTGRQLGDEEYTEFLAEHDQYMV